MSLNLRLAGLDELVLEVGHVVVPVDEALGLGQPDAVDDRGMVELVRDDGAPFVEERLEDAAVGVEGRGVEEGIVHPQEVGHPALELLVDPLRAADEADRSHPEAPAEESVIRGGHDPRLVAEAEVVVGAEVEDLRPGFRPDLNALRGGQDPFFFEETPLPDLPEFTRQMVFESSVHGRFPSDEAGSLYRIGTVSESRLSGSPQVLPNGDRLNHLKCHSTPLGETLGAGAILKAGVPVYPPVPCRLTGPQAWDITGLDDARCSACPCVQGHPPLPAS